MFEVQFEPAYPKILVADDDTRTAALAIVFKLFKCLLVCTLLFSFPDTFGNKNAMHLAHVHFHIVRFHLPVELLLSHRQTAFYLLNQELNEKLVCRPLTSLESDDICKSIDFTKLRFYHADILSGESYNQTSVSLNSAKRDILALGPNSKISAKQRNQLQMHLII